MRRMLTEADVEKLDSMQDPKEANIGYVLTCNGKGEAVYRPATGGREYSLTVGSMGVQDLNLNFYTPDPPLPESEFGYNQLAAIIWQNNPIDLKILTMTGNNGTTIHGNLSANDGIIIQYENDRIIVYVSEEIQQQLNINSGDSIPCKAIISSAYLEAHDA